LAGYFDSPINFIRPRYCIKPEGDRYLDNKIYVTPNFMATIAIFSLAFLAEAEFILFIYLETIGAGFIVANNMVSGPAL